MARKIISKKNFSERRNRCNGVTVGLKAAWLLGLGGYGRVTRVTLQNFERFCVKPLPDFFSEKIFFWLYNNKGFFEGRFGYILC